MNCQVLTHCMNISYAVLVTVAEQSEVCIVFARLEAGIVGSNPTKGTDV
jgi:hypothetical protein